MSIELNHTIVWSSDRDATATFLTEILGLPDAPVYGPFRVVQVAGVSLDVGQATGEVHPQHYAFLVGDREFDEIFGRVRDRGLSWWADPMLTRAGEINHHDGGRGVYWQSPDRHILEIITVPYGGAAA
ncbi:MULTISPECIES: VOC family protein [Pseudofrankia]|uniref:VOC family protein n=1 Tax=Pseudofrankia TaxID=2994363 RepID=UPI000234C51C|nr:MULTISPECIES: VOC family protein [Pseudofrankia]OHV30356.1 bleomycin resistance protein [Pseudofrankia sp. EUN1h]